MDYPRKRGAVTPVTNLDVWRPLIACLTFVIETIIKAAVKNIQIQTCVDCFFSENILLKLFLNTVNFILLCNCL